MFLVDDGIVDGGSEPHVGDVKEHFGGKQKIAVSRAAFDAARVWCYAGRSHGPGVPRPLKPWTRRPLLPTIFCWRSPVLLLSTGAPR